MCPNFGFGCRVFVRKGTRRNVYAKMKAENNMDATKVETNEVTDPIPEHEPSFVDVLQKVNSLHPCIPTIGTYILVYSTACH